MRIPFLIAYSIAILLGYSLLLFLFLILRRFYLRIKTQRFQRIYTLIEEDIIEALARQDPEFSRRVANKFRPFHNILTQVLIDYRKSVQGKESEQLKIIFDHSIKKSYSKYLHSRLSTRRLKASRIFVLFPDSAMVPELRKLIHDKPLIRLTVINALSRIPSLETIEYIFQAFVSDSSPNFGSYFNIFYGLRGKAEPFIRKYLNKELPVEKLGLLIETVGYSSLHGLFDDIRRFVTHEKKEIRVRVARTMGNLMHPDSVDLLILMARDEFWEVQAQAVKSLGKLKDPRSLEVLSDALQSPSWYVRLNAGYSLARLGTVGLKRLMEIASKHEDRYAADMATMVLDETIHSEVPS